MAPPDQRLVLRYDHRGEDGTGAVVAEVRFGHFAGRSLAGFADDDLLAFAGAASGYPLGDERPRISGGYDLHLAHGDEHVGLTVRTVDPRGQLGVPVHLATPLDAHDLPGWLGADLRVEVLTSYEALGRFTVQLRGLVAGRVAEASLDREVLVGW